MTAIYLNHAGTSWPQPAVVEQALTQALSTTPLEWPAIFERCHTRLAKYFGVDDPTRLLLTPGCTSALAVGIADHEWTAGDRVLISSWEHHAVTRPCWLLQQQGVQVDRIPGSLAEPFALEKLREELQRGGVRLLVMTAASNVTGAWLPYADAIAVAHEYGVKVLLDGAQAVGWRDFNLPALGVDLFAFGSHKGLLAPWGLGGLYVAADVEMNSPGAQCELRPTDAPKDSPPQCDLLPGYCDVGSVDRITLQALTAALDWLSVSSADDRLAKAQRQCDQLVSVLAEFPHVEFHSPRDSADRLPTVAFIVKSRSPADISQDLEAHGLIASTGFQCAPLAHETLGTSTAGVVRLSVGMTNDDAEILRAADVLRTVLQPG